MPAWAPLGNEKISFDEYDGEKFDYGLIIGAKIPLNSEISLIGNYYFSFADLYEDIDMFNLIGNLKKWTSFK